MGTEENKAIYRRIVEENWNQRNEALLDGQTTSSKGDGTALDPVVFQVGSQRAHTETL